MTPLKTLIAAMAVAAISMPAGAGSAAADPAPTPLTVALFCAALSSDAPHGDRVSARLTHFFFGLAGAIRGQELSAEEKRFTREKGERWLKGKDEAELFRAGQACGHFARAAGYPQETEQAR
jgi:hypothetical protein